MNEKRSQRSGPRKYQRRWDGTRQMNMYFELFLFILFLLLWFCGSFDSIASAIANKHLNKLRPLNVCAVHRWIPHWIFHSSCEPVFTKRRVLWPHSMRKLILRPFECKKIVNRNDYKILRYTLNSYIPETNTHRHRQHTSVFHISIQCSKWEIIIFNAKLKTTN